MLLLGTLSGCATGRGAVEEAEAVKHGPMRVLSMKPEEFLASATGTYVLVDLDVNRLRLMNGKQVLWDAAVGTGTGLRLEGETGEWDFSTPRGVYQIQFKEEVPVWHLPDWYFVEKGLPIPPIDHPSRKQPGQLGSAAVFIGEDLAIHGTERPELLGQRVSHGCIRLANQYAQRLFHNVQIGTPVVIMGGEHLDDAPPATPTDPGKPRSKKAKAKDPLAGLSTSDLLARLDRGLARPDTAASWVPVASRLLTRGLRDDAGALRGILERAGTGATEQVNREYATFLADAFSRGGLRTVVSLARIDAAARDRAARDIVEATLALHPFGAADPSAPWPTRRVPPSVLGPDGRDGWEALAAAEKSHRAALAPAPAPAPTGAKKGRDRR